MTAIPPKPEHERTGVILGTYAVQRRSTRIQSSGIFRFPLELFLEILSYFTDHRRFIRENFHGRELYADVKREHAERSIIIRKLTMTCWPLRNLLLPLLWTDPEGCISHTCYDHETRTGGSGYSLYAQCVYLISNPTIAAYVQTFSVELDFSEAPGDLMARFVDCLVRLPNLETLEVLKVSSQDLISKALWSGRCTFPSIRVLRITQGCHCFITNCPNLEDLTFTTGLDTSALATVRAHGERLKRIAGVNIYYLLEIDAIAKGCPNLREIGIIGNTQFTIEPIKHLRQLEYLAIVDANLCEMKNLAGAVQEKAREIWKRELIGLLKDSPSTDRKVLRWKVVQICLCPNDVRLVYDIVESEESEVFPETSL